MRYDMIMYMIWYIFVKYNLVDTRWQ